VGVGVEVGRGEVGGGSGLEDLLGLGGIPGGSIERPAGADGRAGRRQCSQVPAAEPELSVYVMKMLKVSR
jgi:hypothetical protein